MTNQPPIHDRLAWIDAELESLAANQLLRQLRAHEGPQTALLRLGGRELINFSSNDYLGLAADARLARAVVEAARGEGCGAGASPLVFGRGAWHQRLERRLADFEQTEAAIVFSSGFAANLGAIAALVGPRDVVFSDALNHASMIDGCRLSQAVVKVYPHGDLGRLAELLQTAHAHRRRLIVTDGLFSMDGDLARLAELAHLAERYDCMLMVDEAHATGVLGRLGRGAAEQLGVHERIDVRVGTLSKALGSAGGFVCGRRSLIEWLLNRARSYVFSTALPPAACAAAVAALDIVRDEPQRRQGLLERAAGLRARLQAQGWNVGPTASHIIPVIVGDPGRAMDLSAALARRGVLAPAIRPPSVPAGQSRLRISLTFGHTPEMIEAFERSLAELRQDWDDG